MYAAANYTTAAQRDKLPGAPESPGLYRFELPSLRMTQVPVSPDLGILDLVVSQRQDKLLVSGQIRKNGRLECGLYEVHLPNGETKRVMERSDCEYKNSWNQLDLSPDGEMVLATRRGVVELIDLRTHSIQTVGKGNGARWSPDGVRIALLDGVGVDLLDARTLKKTKRISEGIAGGWSPDSRYLIGEDDRGCGAYLFTLSAVDVVTGTKTIFESSRCKLSRGQLGWVNVTRP